MLIGLLPFLSFHVLEKKSYKKELPKKVKTEKNVVPVQTFQGLTIIMNTEGKQIPN